MQIPIYLLHKLFIFVFSECKSVFPLLTSNGKANNTHVSNSVFFLLKVKIVVEVFIQKQNIYNTVKHLTFFWLKPGAKR